MVIIKFGRNILMGIVLLTSISITTIVYSAYNTQLNIQGEAVFRNKSDIRITGLRVTSKTNGAYETYNNKYAKDTTNFYVTLPSKSSITYEVEVTNKTNYDYKMDTLEELSNNNSNIIVESILKNKVIFQKNNVSKYTIVLKNDSDIEEEITLIYKYNFVLNNYLEVAQNQFEQLKTKVIGNEGVYFFDENGDLDYGDNTKIYLNLKEDIPKGVVSIWNNKPIYVCLNYGNYNYEYDTTKSSMVKREMPCLVNRYDNLVINGDLSYGSNYNLSGFGDYEEGYLFSESSVVTEEAIDDYIPVDVNKKYLIGVDLKASNTSAIYYAGVMEYDADKNLVDSFSISFLPGTLTVLARDLNPGDTIVYFNDLSSWNNNTSAYYQKGFHFWGYKDSTGYEYPELTYSRYTYFDIYENSAMDKENNTITLLSGWSGPMFKAGTKVSQLSAGGNYNYAILGGRNLSLDWASFSNYVNYTSFRSGTKYVKLFVWTNFNSTPNTTTYKKNFYMEEVK